MFLLLLPFAPNLLCPGFVLANDTGWPTLGKTNTTLKPPERRDSGTESQSKSPPSGSPVTPNAEKVSRRILSNYSQNILFFFFPESIKINNDFCTNLLSSIMIRLTFTYEYLFSVSFLILF